MIKINEIEKISSIYSLEIIRNRYKRFSTNWKKLSVSKSNMVYYISRTVTNKDLEIKEKV